MSKQLDSYQSSLIAVADNTPPIKAPSDAEVDLEILRTVPKQFEINDEKSANWLVRKIITARLYADHVKSWAAYETRRAEREEQTLLYLYGRQLEGWAKDEVEKLNGKKKSIALPSGTVGFRTANPSLQIDDEQVVLGWAKEHLPTAVVITEKLSRTTLKDHFAATGVIPDEGAHIDEGGERFFVR